MSDYFKRVQAKTRTQFWINNVTEEEAHLAIENGAVYVKSHKRTYKAITTFIFMLVPILLLPQIDFSAIICSILLIRE